MIAFAKTWLGARASDDNLVEQVAILAAIKYTLQTFNSFNAAVYYTDSGERISRERWSGSAKAYAHHPRRCIAMNGAHRRCSKWALVGGQRCHYHARIHGRSTSGVLLRRKINEVYTKHLLPKLREKLEAIESDSRCEDRLQLYKEIDLTRALLVQTLESHALMSAAVEARLNGANHAALINVTPEMVRALETQAQNYVSLIADLVSKMAKIDKDMREDYTLGVRQLGYVARGITALLSRHLGDSPEAAAIVKGVVEDLDELRIPMGQLPPQPIEVGVVYE